jgi:hypothetical protein
MEYSGRTTAYEHKDDSANPDEKPWSEIPHSGPMAVRRDWILDAQWSDCPIEVEDDIRRLWRFEELGNDNFILKRSISDFLKMLDQDFEEWDEVQMKWIKQPFKLDYLIDYLRQNLADDEKIFIHWWW